MKASLVSGASGSATIRVGATRTVGFMGRRARMDATPMRVRDMDTAAREFPPDQLAAKAGEAGLQKEDEE